MKFFLKLSLTLLLLNFSLPNFGIACEFLKEQIGTPVSNIIEKYDDLDEPPGGDNPNATYVKELSLIHI